MRSAPWHPAGLEERMRQFIAADIEQGIICADLAARVVAREQEGWRQHLIDNAEQAHAEAAQRLNRAAVFGWNVAMLRVRLKMLDDMLARVKTMRREAA